MTAEGAWLWDIYTPNGMFPSSGPVLADVDGDSVPELYVGTCWNHLFRIDLETRKVVFAHDTTMHVNTCVQASDIDGDGNDEVVFGSKAGAS